jgi:hypothetical protein
MCVRERECVCVRERVRVCVCLCSRDWTGCDGHRGCDVECKPAFFLHQATATSETPPELSHRRMPCAPWAVANSVCAITAYCGQTHFTMHVAHATSSKPTPRADDQAPPSKTARTGDVQKRVLYRSVSFAPPRRVAGCLPESCAA